MPSSQETYSERIPVAYAGRIATGYPAKITSYRAGGTIRPGRAVHREGNANVIEEGVSVGATTFPVDGFLGVAHTKHNDTTDSWKEDDMVMTVSQGDVWVEVSDATSASKTPRPGDVAQIVTADGTFRRGGTASANLGITSNAGGVNAVFQSGLHDGGDGKKIAKVRLFGTQIG